MAVIREGGTDVGSQRGRKGGTKGMLNLKSIINHRVNNVNYVNPETWVFKPFNGGLFTLYTLWLIIYFGVSLFHRSSTQFLLKLNLPVL